MYLHKTHFMTRGSRIAAVSRISALQKVPKPMSHFPISKAGIQNMTRFPLLLNNSSKPSIHPSSQTRSFFSFSSFYPSNSKSISDKINISEDVNSLSSSLSSLPQTATTVSTVSTPTPTPTPATPTSSIDSISTATTSSSNEIVLENGVDLIDKTLNVALSAGQKLESITTIGDLHSLGLASYYTPTGWIQNAIEFCYLSFDLPWWATLVVATFIIRSALFPLAVKAQKASVDLQKLKPIIDPIKERASVLQQRGDSQGALKENQKIIQVFKVSIHA